MSITRRDFLNGVALTIGAGLIPQSSLFGLDAAAEYAPELNPSYYPPGLTGLRGNHEGSYDAAHALRDGTFWKQAGAPEKTGEQYDLVIVGAGLSGLAAAHFYRSRAGNSARILLLDNHDDFGGHAKRNEFDASGTRTILGYGGTFSIDSPARYSDVARSLIQQVGIDMSSWSRVYDRELYPSLGLHGSVFFDRATFGVDKLVRFGTVDPEVDGAAALNNEEFKAFIAQLPLAEKARADLLRVYADNTDYLPGLSSAQKKERLARISYRDFLLDLVKAHEDVVKYFQSRPHGLYGIGVDGVPAQDAWGLGFPGFQGMALEPGYGKGMNRDAMIDPEGGEAYFFHFPDGNATIARLLVRGMIPGAIPGNTVEDILGARCNYAKLDAKDSAVRIRLNSTVVRAQQSGESVEVTYQRGGKLRSVSGKHVVLACWSTIIPMLCPDMPDAQREALAYATKVPLLYTNVLLSNWNSFVKAGVSGMYCPGAYHSYVTLDMPVSIGDYRCSRKPEEPVVLHMMRSPCKPGLPARKQHAFGRGELFTTPFEEYERQVRGQLNAMLGSHGFDAGRDIRAITVNRWAHGYAYQYNSLFDDFWLNGGETPCERARKPFGRITIANADAAAYSYTDAAIDEAHRAVLELNIRTADFSRH